jgi:hypothetical protein
MEYEVFVEHVRSQGRLTSHEAAIRAITATLSTLRDVLAETGDGVVPDEIARLLPPSYGFAGSHNPQMANQTRIESGGESTRESGQ